MEQAEKGMENELIDAINKTRQELVKLTKPASLATYKFPGKKIFQYNVMMLAKYFHLLEGSITLLQNHNYFSQIILLRAIFEIKMYLRYFYKNPSELALFLKNSREYTKKNKTINKIIREGAPDPNSASNDLAQYDFLCSVQHPSPAPIRLLTAEQVISRETIDEVLTRFGPAPDPDGVRYALVTLLESNNFMLEFEYLLLKSDKSVIPEDKLLKESKALFEKYRKIFFLNQKGVKEKYQQLKNKRLQELNSPDNVS